VFVLSEFIGFKIRKVCFEKSLWGDFFFAGMAV
jgi:hypothetical protein